MCTSGCPTPGVHGTWGECLRSKAIQFTEIAGHEARKANDNELQAYYDARMQGVQPKGTRLEQTRQALEFANKTGTGDPWQ